MKFSWRLITKCLTVKKKQRTSNFECQSLDQFSSVAQSCPTLFNPIVCNTPSFPVHHQLLELNQTHIHWFGDAIQPSYPLSSPSPAFNLSQHQGFPNESVFCIRWPKYWSFSFSISPYNEYSGPISSRIDWFNSLKSRELSRVFSNTTAQKHQVFCIQPSLWSNCHNHAWLLENHSFD